MSKTLSTSQRKLHVSSIPFEYPARNLGQTFERFGAIEYCDVHSFTTYSYAFVLFYQHDDATNAKLGLDGHVIGGSPIRVRWATDREMTLNAALPPRPLVLLNNGGGREEEVPFSRSAGMTDASQAWCNTDLAFPGPDASDDVVQIRPSPAMDVVSTQEIFPQDYRTDAGDAAIASQSTIDEIAGWEQAAMPHAGFQSQQVQVHTSGMVAAWSQEQSSQQSNCGSARLHHQGSSVTRHDRVRRGRGPYYDRDAAPRNDTDEMPCDPPIMRKRARSTSDDEGHDDDHQQGGNQADGKRGRGEDEGW